MKKLVAITLLVTGFASLVESHGTKTPSPKHNSPQNSPQNTPRQSTPRDFTTPRCGTKTPSPASTPRK